MSPELLTAGMFGLLLVFILAGVSLAFALGSVAVIFVVIMNGLNGLFPILSATFASMWSISLAAIPLFVMMGISLGKSKIASDLYLTFHLWSGKVNGGLLVGTTGFASLLSAMTGSCAASTLTTGMVGMPAMDKHGYDKKFVLGTIGAAGTLGILIPPSITLIVIGMSTGLSIGKLFMGGLIAGLGMLAVILAYVIIKANLQPEKAPAATESVPLAEKIHSLRAVILPVGIISVVLFSIFLGIATPTEAAAVGAAAVLIAIAIRGELNWDFLKEVSYSTATMSGMVLWIIFGASAFVSVYSAANGIDFIQSFLLSLDISPWLLILIMQVAGFILGMFLDPIGIILLVMPIFMPVVTQLGFDPIWFAVIFQLNLCVGYISPPFGYNIFYLKTLSPQTSILDLYRSVFPYVVLMILFGVFLLAFPSILTDGVRLLTKS
ncbi:TRAP transporter large permease subunit [Marinobacter sp. tcs-11]|uniref:TRAP transporter large permease n=1 Tax=Marinobacter sp. tcs-11 TaxID=1742860 RepID=UPI00257CB2DD|nr:TRAP transporter large permease subunit [Marinobacter sp. tcs-11]MCP4063857.1 TRAP transporter large permease subunit [Gammaproteobacteria bacterium]